MAEAVYILRTGNGNNHTPRHRAAGTTGSCPVATPRAATAPRAAHRRPASTNQSAAGQPALSFPQRRRLFPLPQATAVATAEPVHANPLPEIE